MFFGWLNGTHRCLTCLKVVTMNSLCEHGMAIQKQGMMYNGSSLKQVEWNNVVLIKAGILLKLINDQDILKESHNKLAELLTIYPFWWMSTMSRTPEHEQIYSNQLEDSEQS